MFIGDSSQYSAKSDSARHFEVNHCEAQVKQKVDVEYRDINSISICKLRYELPRAVLKKLHNISTCAQYEWDCFSIVLSSLVAKRKMVRASGRVAVQIMANKYATLLRSR